MISIDAYRAQWFGNIRGDVLSGLVVALALIPEAIAFSIIAGVDPKVGLYASFSIAVITAITGGRPGMISAATAATAVLMVTLVRDHGLEYLLAATVLAGLIQIGMGVLRLGFVMRYVSKSVMTGFVNALAILIFMAQLPELDPRAVSWITYVLVAAGLGIIYLFPLLTKAVPSPLVTIIVLTALTLALGLDVRTVGDMGALPDTLPVFLIPDIPLTSQTLMIILPYSVAVAVVGLLESLMTQNIVDDLTDTKSNRSQEMVGQGIANTATGRARAAVVLCRGSVPADPRGGAGRCGQPHSDGSTCGDHDHGVGGHVFLVVDPQSARASALVLDRDDRDGGDSGLYPQPRYRGAGGGAFVGHLLCRQDRAAFPGHERDFKGRARTDLPGRGAAFLWLGRGFHECL
jgi:SulP family sulfate permease